MNALGNGDTVSACAGISIVGQHLTEVGWCCALCLHIFIVAWSLEEIKSYIP